MANITYWISVAIILLTPITGIIILIDALFLKKKRLPNAKLPFLVDWSNFLFPVVLIVAVLRSFIAEPYIIPSGSMQPTLYEGDMIIANKWAFGLRYPLINKRIFSQEGEGIQRGDVAIFKFPEDERINYVKRIVALPGDRVDYRDKKFIINGEPLDYKVIGPAKTPDTHEVFVEETMPTNGKMKHYHIQNRGHLTETDYFLQGDFPPPQERLFKQQFPKALQFPLTVPQGQYLAMGDNRDNSFDGRYWGFVEDRQILAKANFIWMNYRCISGKFSECKRIFTKIE